MSEMVRLKPGVWPSQPVAPEALQDHLQANSVRADEVERNGRSKRRREWVSLVIGGALALAGVGIAGYVVLNRDPIPPFALINQTTGEITRLAASDAPRHFNNDTARQYLRMFVENCDSWNFDNWRKTYDRCVLLMSPEMQAKYRDVFFRATSPMRAIGDRAIIVTEGLRYTKQPRQDSLQSWLVRYNQVEYRNGQKTRSVPVTATVYFEWRPNMSMTEEVRTWNTAGMRVTDYSFGSDVPQ